MSQQTASKDLDSTSTSNVVALVLAWGAVGIPFLYGVYKTVDRASALFTG